MRQAATDVAQYRERQINNKKRKQRQDNMKLDTHVWTDLPNALSSRFSRSNSFLPPETLVFADHL